MMTPRPSLKLRKFFWILTFLAAVFMLGVYVFLSGLEYLRSSAFEELIEKQLGQVIGGKVDLEKSSFQWQEGTVQKVEATSHLGVSAQLENVHSYWQVGEAMQTGIVELQKPKVQQALLTLSDASKVDQATESESLIAPEVKRSSRWSWSYWVPQKVVTEDIHVDRLEVVSTLAGGNFHLGAMQYEIQPNENFTQWRWLARSTQGAEWKLPGMPLNYLVHKAAWTLDAKKLTVQEVQGKTGKDGVLKLEGSKSFENPDEWILRGALAGIHTSELPKELANVEGFIKGVLKAEFEAQPKDVSGKITLSDAQSKAPEALKLLGELLKSDRLRTLHWDTAQSEFKQQGEIVYLEKLKLESSGLICIEGDVQIHSKKSKTPKKLEGRVWLGITKSMFRWIPLLETQLFGTTRPESPGYLWTEVTLSGTTDKPKEDFSLHLADLIQKGVIQVSEQTLGSVDKFLKPVLPAETKTEEVLKLPEEVLKEGRKLLKEALPILQGR